VVRLPKFLGYFERVLELNRARGPWMVGARLSYVDLSMAAGDCGSAICLPRSQPPGISQPPAAARAARRCLCSAANCALRRLGPRLAFNNEDLFRYYPELDR